MGSHSNSRKAETLGMPHGTANGRLRKSIMFKYVQLAGHDFCFKCGAQIETVDDLSVEHKLPWEGVSADLFFDLDNIAFSHVQCNRPDRPNYYVKPFEEGYAECSECQQIKPVTEFIKNKNRSRGIDYQCKSCKSIRNRKRYAPVV
jgi:hypothetical protein